MPPITDVEILRPAAARQITIAQGQMTSDAYDAHGYAMFGLLMPASFTGTEISFEVSADGSTWLPLYDTAGIAVVLPVVQGRAYEAPTELAAFSRWRVVSDAAEAAARTLTVVAKG